MASLPTIALPKWSREEMSKSDIQKEAIRYGEMVESVYDGNNLGKEGTEFYCYPLFGKSELFSKVHLEGRGYKITRYIYATEGSGEKTCAKWFGYIAVSDDELTESLGRRDVVVTFRGTEGNMLTGSEWWSDYNAWLVPFGVIVDGGLKPYVHKGFYNLYTSSYRCLPSEFGEISARDQIIQELKTILDTYGDQQVRINVTGHSLGGALATLAACDVGHNLAKDRAGASVYAYTFGSPRVGDKDFGTAIDGCAKVMRFTNKADIVPRLPPTGIWPIPYVDVGTHWMVHFAGSPYIATIDFGWICPETRLAAWSKCHNLELSLHAIAAGKFTTTLLAGVETYMASYKSLQKNKNFLEETGNASVVEATEDILQNDDAAVQDYLREVQEVIQEQQGAESLHPPRKRARMLMMMAKATPSEWDTRDFALVNKSQDLLRDEYKQKIPPYWWNVLVNKDLKLYEGKWVPRDEAAPKDNPTPENPDYN